MAGVEAVIAVAGPLAPLHVEQQHATEWWVIRLDYSVVIWIDGIPYTLHLPAGFRYNRSSIPGLAEWLTLRWMTKDKLGCHAAGPHDGLYGCDGEPQEAPPMIYLTGQQQLDPQPWCTPWRKFSKAETDEIFYRTMLLDEVEPTRALWAWRAVRWFARRW